MDTGKGVFITFEGGDGTGKSTQAKLLRESLAFSGIEPIVTREPGGTIQAERIRDLLLQRDSGNFDPMTEALLLFAARREHLVTKIWPALERGQWVISDRFADSTRAFQGYGLGLDLQTIENLYGTVVGTFQPDLTLVFDIDPAQGLQRSSKRSAMTANRQEATEDRYERMGIAFHTRLREGYLSIAKQNPGRCVIIDAAPDVASVHRAVLNVIQKRFHLSAMKEAKYG